MTAYCLSKYGQDSPLSPKGHSTFINCVEQIKDKTCPHGETWRCALCLKIYILIACWGQLVCMTYKNTLLRLSLVVGCKTKCPFPLHFYISFHLCQSNHQIAIIEMTLLLYVMLINLFVSLSATCDRSVVFSGYSGFLHQ